MSTNESCECPACGQEIAIDSSAYPEACPDCQERCPPSLLKACVDPFDYALRLRTGEVVRFNYASIHGEYATLTGHGPRWETPVEGLKFPCPRGVDVRISDIVWCADAPEGS